MTGDATAKMIGRGGKKLSLEKKATVIFIADDHKRQKGMI